MLKDGDLVLIKDCEHAREKGVVGRTSVVIEIRDYMMYSIILCIGVKNYSFKFNEVVKIKTNEKVV